MAKPLPPSDIDPSGDPALPQSSTSTEVESSNHDTAGPSHPPRKDDPIRIIRNDNFSDPTLSLNPKVLLGRVVAVLSPTTIHAEALEPNDDPDGEPHVMHLGELSGVRTITHGALSTSERYHHTIEWGTDLDGRAVRWCHPEEIVGKTLKTRRWDYRPEVRCPACGMLAQSPLPTLRSGPRDPDRERVVSACATCIERALASVQPRSAEATAPV